MSQHTPRRDQRATSDQEDVETPQPRPRKPVDQPDGDGGPFPNKDEPGDREFELAGDDDLGPADLGPLRPGASDPDTESGRPRKIVRDGGRPAS